jgi:predicted metal-dependent hydrolase
VFATASHKQPRSPKSPDFGLKNRSHRTRLLGYLFSLRTHPLGYLRLNICFGYNRRMSTPIDRLVRSHRKTIALVIERDGRLTVRAPLRMPAARIQEFVESHSDWIEKNLARLRAAPPLPARRYLEGETFLYLGVAYPLSLVTAARPALAFDGASFRLAKSSLPEAAGLFARWYKLQARLFLTGRVLATAGKHAFRYQKIRISSARTRWGSCSSGGTLSFTYRLVMAPPEVVDYVVLHELVHTQVHNHSKTFWNRVAQLMPDYKVRLAWLKKNGKFLM